VRPLEAQPISRSEIVWLAGALLCLIAMPVLRASHLVRPDSVWMDLPLLATIFVVLGWHAHRTGVARNQASLAARAERLLLQRQRDIRIVVGELRRLKDVNDHKLSAAQTSAASLDAIRPRSGTS
jgi:hypothetical protein